jgi:hypothetical protein
MPAKEVLQFLHRKKYDISSDIGYECRGQDRVAEVRAWVRYSKDALAQAGTAGNDPSGHQDRPILDDQTS